MENPPDATPIETEQYEHFIMQVKIFLKNLPKPESKITARRSRPRFSRLSTPTNLVPWTSENICLSHSTSRWPPC